MVKVTSKGNSKEVMFFDSLQDAIYEMADARGDNDYSFDSFKDCYSYEEIEE